MSEIELCKCDPCTCGCCDPVFTSTSGITFCDGDRRNNVWLEGSTPEGYGGICLIDTMTKSQIIYVLERDDKARADLMRVTSNVDLQELAATVPRLPGIYEGDRLQKEINANEKLIMYTHFRGQPPFNG